jgi:hypothetical protein
MKLRIVSVTFFNKIAKRHTFFFQSEQDSKNSKPGVVKSYDNNKQTRSSPSISLLQIQVYGDSARRQKQQ